MSARSGLAEKKSSRPYLGPSEAIFSMDRKNPKNVKILPIFPVWALAAIHPGWGNRSLGDTGIPVLNRAGRIFSY